MLRVIRGSKWFPVALLSFLWCGAVIFVSPFASMPFGDEFAYIRPVQQFLQSGEIHYTDWSSMTLILQVWIGAVCSWLFGFSLTTLRMVSTLFGLSAIIALYFCARKMGAEKGTAFFLTLLLAFNPVFFLTGLLFLTDVPFLGIALWSVFFFIDFLQSDNTRSFLLAVVLCLCAFFIRDVAIILPPAFALALILKHGISKRTLLLSAVALISIACCYIGWRWWLVHLHGLPKNIDFSRNKLMNTLSSPLLFASAFGRNIIYTAGYFGMYCLPLLPILVVTARRLFSIKQWVLFGIVGSLALTAAFSIGRLHGYLLDHIWDATRIYIRFDNVYTLSNESIPQLPQWVLHGSVVLALLSGLLLGALVLGYIVQSLRSLRQNKQQAIPALFAAFCLCIYCALMFTQWMISRYYLVMLPFLLLLLYKVYTQHPIRLNAGVRRLSGLALVFVLYMALCAGHDVFARIRANTEAFHYLEKELRIASHDIDGGMDYNTWTNYYYDYKSTKKRNWWWVENPRYVVADGHIQSMQLLKVVPYTRWYFPGYEAKVYVHRNTELP